MSFPSESPAAAARLAFGPGRLDFTADGVPRAPDFGDVYHGAVGAWAQAQHVFLGGNGLPGRWQGRERFVILETGFGLGNNFLATWAAWREDAQRCERLVFLSVEKHPLTRDDLARALAAGRAGAPPVHAELSAALLAQWPLATPDHHLLSFDDGRVQLHLALGEVVPVLRGIDAEVDAFFLDGFAPARNPAMWAPEVLRRIARLAVPAATVATWSAARAVREGLTSGGFRVEALPGFGGKRDMTRAVYAPVHHPARPGSQAVLATAAIPSSAAPTPPEAATAAPHEPPCALSTGQAPVAGTGSPRRPPAPRREALVIGAGLAGCAAAWALARQGWRATVLDRHATPAQETSGNPGGLMHGIFNAPDSLHARWFRAAALHAAGWAREPVARGLIAGRIDGFLRLETRRRQAEARAQLAQVDLPRDWVDWADHRALNELSGLDFAGSGVKGAWHFASGGWLSPADCCRWWLAEARRLAGARWQGAAEVATCRSVSAPDGPGWQVLDHEGRVLAEAPVLVLATSLATPALLASLLPWTPAGGNGVAGAGALPLEAVRGQTTVVPAALAGWRAPLRALSGQGYALALPEGRLLCGATSQRDDAEPRLREADHRHNLQRAAGLGVVPATAPDDPDWLAAVTGRVGWRAVTPDRLPVAGPPVDLQAEAAARAAGRRLDAVRHRPRCHGLHPLEAPSAPSTTTPAPDPLPPALPPPAPGQRHGLYLLTGLGSRGLTSAGLAAEVLASWISGAPCPVPSDLRDAIDPARFSVPPRAALRPARPPKGDQEPWDGPAVP